MRNRRLLVTVLLPPLLTVGACTAGKTTTDAADIEAPATAPPTPTAAPAPLVVPDVVGSAPSDALADLRAAGLRPRLTSDVHQSCGHGTAVTATSPPAGRPPGRRRVVTVVAPDRRTTCDVPPRLQAVGARFVDFARGRGPAPDVADAAPLLLGNERVGTLTPASAGDRGAWGGCPPGVTGVFGGSCPISALGLVGNNARNGYADDLSTEISPGPCDGVLAPRPDGLDHLDLVVVTVLPDVASCAHGGRTELYVDDHGRVAVVDIVFSEP